MSNFSFSHKVCKSCLLLMRQNEYLWGKGLINAFRVVRSFFLVELVLASDKSLKSY